MHPGSLEDLPTGMDLAAGEDDELRGLQVFAVLRFERGVDLAALGDPGGLHRSREDLVVLLAIAVGGPDIGGPWRFTLTAAQRRLE